jgi:hypothetical protein
MSPKKKQTGSIYARRPHQIPVRLTSEERNGLRELAYKRDMKMSALMREAVVAFLVAQGVLTKSRGDEILAKERQTKANIARPAL